MENLKSMLVGLMIENLEGKEEKGRKNFLMSWALKNNKVDWEKAGEGFSSLENFVEQQKNLGYLSGDLEISVKISPNEYPGIDIKNRINGANKYASLQYRMFPVRESLTKNELLEAEKPYFDLVAENRKKYLNNGTACREFIEKGNFYQNSLEKMAFDKETHDFVLEVSQKIEQEEKNEKEAAKERLKKWAMENGSPLLQKRIHHGHNWGQMAIDEYAFSQLPNFLDDPYYKDCLVIESYEVKNGTLGQLEILEGAQTENPGIGFDIVRFKYSYEGENIYSIYLRANVPSIVGNTYLYKEITETENAG